MKVLVLVAAWGTAVVGIGVFVFVLAATKQLLGDWSRNNWDSEKTIDALLNVVVFVVAAMLLTTGLLGALG